LPTTGKIALDDQDITRMPTHKRELGMVFQSLALFPHLSVGENIAYPLRIRGAGKQEQKQRVDELLDMIHLKGFADRPVAKLSGGQRQRVAIARALTIAPKLFLLDEPLSALDAKLREAMQVELRQLQQRLGITTIVVTHDQREAMTMADTVVVMNGGEIRQVAPPIEIYRRPADSFVADFIGQTNLLELEKDAAQRVLAFGQAVEAVTMPDDLAKGILCVRPEDIELIAPREGVLSGQVSFIRDLGATTETFIDIAGRQIVAVSTQRENTQIKVGQMVGIAFAQDNSVVLRK
jgi:putative spermidine/putrescine transport system ATP-binding protein